MPLTRRLILQKARHHPTKGAMTDCKHTVSGTISLPSRGTFHLSLTVLNCTIGHAKYSGLPGGPGRFTADSTSPLLLGKHNHYHTHTFTYRALTVYGGTFQSTSPSMRDYHVTKNRQILDVMLPQPHARNPCRVSHARSLAIIHVRSPLLAESQLFSLPTGTEMFHFPA